MWTALNDVAASHKYLWTCPIEWSGSKRCIIYNKPSSKLIPWGVVIFGSVFGIIIVSTSFLLLAINFGLISLPVTNLVIVLMLGLVCICTFFIDVAMFLYFEPGVVGCNYLIQMGNGLPKRKGKI